MIVVKSFQVGIVDFKIDPLHASGLSISNSLYQMIPSESPRRELFKKLSIVTVALAVLEI